MGNTAIHTDNAPAAIGPYSQAIKAGNAIYVSGQLPIDPKTGEFAGPDIESQTRQSLTNVKNILNAYPARAAFQVAAIPKGAKVEIEVVAVI